MMVKKMVGYVVSIVGIGIMAVGLKVIPLNLKILEGVASNYVVGAGIGLIVLGVVLALNKKGRKVSKIKGGEDEIPIYEGVGKTRRVVGYRTG